MKRRSAGLTRLLEHRPDDVDPSYCCQRYRNVNSITSAGACQSFRSVVIYQLERVQIIRKAALTLSSEGTDIILGKRVIWTVRRSHLYRLARSRNDLPSQYSISNVTIA